jgi:hypothetical protein
MRPGIMQNKKVIVSLGILILLVGGAAFVAGKMLNNKVNPLGLFGFGDSGGVMEVSIDLVPAAELPTTEPQIIGLFVERKDKTIVIQSTSLKTGGQGVAVHVGEEGDISPSANMNYGAKVEVLITNDTIIYRDTTPPGKSPSGEKVTVQQTVEESTLDDLNSQSEVIVWGRQSGDRMIAEVLVYNNPVYLHKP